MHGATQCVRFPVLLSSLLRKRRRVCFRLFLNDCPREARCIISKTTLDRAHVAPGAPLVGVGLDIAFPCTPCHSVATAFRSFRAAITSAIIAALPQTSPTPTLIPSPPTHTS